MVGNKKLVSMGGVILKPRYLITGHTVVVDLYDKDRKFVERYKLDVRMPTPKTGEVILKNDKYYDVLAVGHLNKNIAVLVNAQERKK